MDDELDSSSESSTFDEEEGVTSEEGSQKGGMMCNVPTNGFRPSSTRDEHQDMDVDAMESEAVQ